MPMPHTPVSKASTPLPPHTSSHLPPSLIQAYRQAWYEVWLPGHDAQPLQPGASCRLQVDVVQPQLVQAMGSLRARHACLITACNPWGQLLPCTENAARMQALRTALRTAGWTCSPALGRDPQGQWPGEDSLLVWHMNRHQARSWGLQWEQNAVLVMGDDGTPQLECLR